MLAAVGRDRAVVSIMLCDDDTIAELNGQYRNKPIPTDVLSFGMIGDPADGGEVPDGPLGETDEPVLLGDVVISIPTAARQARPAGDLRAEVTRLLAHGLLHLLGWDHAKTSDLRVMEAETDRLIEASRPPTRRYEKD